MVVRESTQLFSSLIIWETTNDTFEVKFTQFNHLLWICQGTKKGGLNAWTTTIESISNQRLCQSSFSLENSIVDMTPECSEMKEFENLKKWAKTPIKFPSLFLIMLPQAKTSGWFRETSLQLILIQFLGGGFQITSIICRAVGGLIATLKNFRNKKSYILRWEHCCPSQNTPSK